MPNVYLKRRDTEEILDTVSVGSVTDPMIPKVLDGLWRLAQTYGGAEVYVDDSEVNPKRKREPKGIPPGDPKGWEAGLGSTQAEGM